MQFKKVTLVLFMVFIAAGIVFCTKITSESFYSETLGEKIEYNIYLPDGYDENGLFYPVIYLLHGRGGSKSDWLPSLNLLDSAVKNGICPPIIAVMPDAPYYSGGSYYVNSEFGEKKYQVETAFTKDLIENIDNNYRSIDERTGRIVCGFSMGGYGALRYSLEYPQLYSGSIVLSPAVYNPLPPLDSSAREFGAFGENELNFVDRIYLSKNYTSLKDHFESSGLRSKIFITVGDDEWQCGEYEHDLDYEAHTLYKYLQKFSGMDAQLRIVDGGHDWDVWGKGFESGLSFMNGYISEPRNERENTVSEGNLSVVKTRFFGNDGEDNAGGIAVDSDGNTYLALNLEGDFESHESLGLKDVFLAKLNSEMEIVWVNQIATSQTEKAYGLELSDNGNIFITGYTKGNIDDGHPSNSKDDVFVACVDEFGKTKWIKQFGDPENADRGYAIAIHGKNVFISGYTKGNIAGENKGDKDIFTASFDEEGNMLWLNQFGTDGEEKCQGMATDDEGDVYLTGLTSGEFTHSFGDYDLFIASFDSAGRQKFISQYGTDEKDEAYDIVFSEEILNITGLTAGNFASENSGDKDVFILKTDRSGKLISSHQFGTELNDKGVKVFSDGKQDFIACISDGKFVRNEGKFDVVIIKIDENGTVDFYQFGSFENDGADDWAEGNLFIGIEDDIVMVSGITYGNFGGSENKGSSDVFVSQIELSTLK